MCFRINFFVRLNCFIFDDFGRHLALIDSCLWQKKTHSDIIYDRSNMASEKFLWSGCAELMQNRYAHSGADIYWHFDLELLKNMGRGAISPLPTLCAFEYRLAGLDTTIGS